MNIQGKIVNANQQPLSGAIAMLASSGQSTISGGDGAFALTNTNAISTEIGEVAINKGTIQIRGNTIYFLFPQSEL
ncbi:MAG: hypothetical protein JXA96_17410, partial [Sedimentisphaerales bacterium]|nr:hypothetical protein [Sedimentisphaerales bacterium]